MILHAYNCNIPNSNNREIQYLRYSMLGFFFNFYKTSTAGINIRIHNDLIADKKLHPSDASCVARCQSCNYSVIYNLYYII